MRFPRLRDADGVAGLSGVAGTANEFRRASGGDDGDDDDSEGDAAESVIPVSFCLLFVPFFFFFLEAICYGTSISPFLFPLRL